MTFSWKSGIKNDDKVKLEITGIGAIVPFACFTTVIMGGIILLFMILGGISP